VQNIKKGKKAQVNEVILNYHTWELETYFGIKELNSKDVFGLRKCFLRKN